MNRDYDDDPGNDYSRDNDEYNPIELERDIADSDSDPEPEPEQEEPDCDVFDMEDDSSSFESIGWGTEEDYGYYGDVW